MKQMRLRATGGKLRGFRGARAVCGGLVVGVLSVVACGPSDEAVGNKRADGTSSDYQARAQDIGDLPAEGDDEATTADDLCLDGCAGDDPGFDDSAEIGGGETGTGGSSSSPGEGVGDGDGDDASEPEPPIELPTIAGPTPPPATVQGAPYIAPLPPVTAVPIECRGGPGIPPPKTSCGKAMAALLPSTCGVEWTTYCVSVMHLQTACVGVAKQCPPVCSAKPDKTDKPPADHAPPLRFDVTAVPQSLSCDYPTTFTSALYKQPHYVSVTRTMVGLSGLPIKSVQKAIADRNLDTAAYLFTLNEPFWKDATTASTARKHLQSGAVFANCVVARLEAYGDLHAGLKDASYCKDLQYDSVVQRSPLTTGVRKLVAYQVGSDQWGDPGEGGKVFRRFLIDFATRLSTVYGIVPTFVIAKSAPTAYFDDWKQLSQVAYIATAAYAHTGDLGAVHDQSKRRALARVRYDKSLAAWTAAGVPKARLLLAEHYGDFEANYSFARCDATACKAAGSSCTTRKTSEGTPFYRCKKKVTFGRAGLSPEVWENVMEARLQAAAQAGFAGTVSMGWSMPFFDNDGVTYQGVTAAAKLDRRERFQLKAYGSFVWTGK